MVADASGGGAAGPRPVAVVVGGGLPESPQPRRVVVVDGYARNVALLRAPLLDTLVQRGHEVIACVPIAPPWVLAKLESIGVRHVALSMRRNSTNPIGEAGILDELVRVFRGLRPDVVLNYTVKPAIWGSLAARLVKVPRSYSFVTGIGHAFIDTSPRGRALNGVVCQLLRRTLRCSDGVFFQNEEDAAEFRRRGLLRPTLPTMVVPGGSGVDLDRFAPVPVHGRPIFLLVGRMLAEKGVREYVAAARILKRRHPQALFQLVGPIDTNPSALGAAELEAWSREGAVEYLGETPDVRPQLGEAGVFVLPSYREGMPRSVLEAMAVGRAIVTTDVPGCRKTVREGENGLLVPPRDVAALARAMERFLLEPDLMVRMGLRSRAIAEEEFDAVNVNAAILRAVGL